MTYVSTEVFKLTARKVAIAVLGVVPWLFSPGVQAQRGPTVLEQAWTARPEGDFVCGNRYAQDGLYAQMCSGFTLYQGRIVPATFMAVTNVGPRRPRWIGSNLYGFSLWQRGEDVVVDSFGCSTFRLWSGTAYCVARLNPMGFNIDKVIGDAWLVVDGRSVVNLNATKGR